MIKKSILFGAMMLVSLAMFGQDAAPAEEPLTVSPGFTYGLLFVAGTLFAAIITMAFVAASLLKAQIRLTNKNKLGLMIGLSLLTQPIWAASANEWNEYFYQGGLQILLGFIIVFELFLAILLFRFIRYSMSAIAPETAEEKTKLAEIAATEPEKLTFYQRLMGLTPMSKEKDLMLEDHSYDGIHELDNRMPPWLRLMFNGTVAFAVVYIILYHYSSWGPNPTQEYEAQMKQGDLQRALYESQKPGVTEATVTLLTDEKSLASGKRIFEANCVACHTASGGGNDVGPNLTDEYWLHGGGIKNVFRTVTYGVENKGMQAWGKMLLPADVQEVSSYILSLQGSKPAGAKGPQGEIYKEEAAATAAPDTAMQVVQDTVLEL